MVLTLLVVVVVALVSSVRQHQDANEWVAHSARVLEVSQAAERKVVDLETGVRGYALTGDRLFLAPWSAARATLPSEIAQLRRLVADNRVQERRVTALRSAIAAYISRYTLPLVKRSRLRFGSDLIAAMTHGKHLLDALRIRFDEFNSTETALQVARVGRSAATDRREIIFAAAAAAVIVLLLGSFVWHVVRLVIIPLRRVIAACAALGAGQRDLRVPVDGSGELEQLAQAFNGMVDQLSSRERELAEAAGELDRQRQALDEAQRMSHVGSWSWDTSVDEATWTPEMYRIFGRDPERGPATSEEFFAYLHPEDRERVAGGYGQTFGGGPSFELDYRIIREDGGVRTLHGIGHRDENVAGCYVGTVQDVTEIRQAEIEVRRERDYAAAITRSMREGFLLTRDGAILEVNQAFCEITGFSREELLGMRAPYAFWAPEATEEIQRQRKLIRGERGHEFETTYMRKDGTRFDASIAAVAARAGDGKLQGYVSTIRDISERKRHEAELERLATHDSLTGMANHRVFHERLRGEMARAGRQGQPLSLAVLDLDHFKVINDQHGHPAGDRVLREAAHRLFAIAREGELLARVGGEEFAWILNADGLDAFTAAERARHAISASPFPQVGTVTLSIGLCDLTDAGDSDDLFQQADQALYWAKRHGRNRTFRYSPDVARELTSQQPKLA